MIALGMSLFGVACGGDEPEAPGAALVHEVDRVGGIPVVRSSGRAPAWSTEMRFSVGTEARPGEPAPDEFGRITSVTPDRAGNLWVADALNAEIRVFGPGGVFLRRLGGEGQGPGEFLSIYSIAWVGDHVLVLDFGNGRVGELDSVGAWIGQREAPGRVSGPTSLLRFYPVTDSTTYQWSVNAVDRGMTITWVEQGPEGVRNEWERLSIDPPKPQSVVCRSDGGIGLFDVPFGGQMLQHPAGSGNTWVAWSSDYRIALIAPDGDTLKLVERRLEPVPLSDAEWDGATTELAEFQREWPGAKCEPRGFDRPQAKAALKSLLMDTEGRLWTEIHTASGTAWEIFDPEGKLMGTLAGFDYDDRVAIALRFGLLTWVDQDSLGVQRAHLASIVPNP